MFFVCFSLQRNEEVVGRSSFPMQFFPTNNAALPQEYFCFQRMVSLVCLLSNIQYDTNYEEYENGINLNDAQI